MCQSIIKYLCNILIMPPKKAEEEQGPPYSYQTVFPIFHSDLLEVLTRPVNLKKNLNASKIIELLKDKGLERHLTEDKSISPEAEDFISSNLQLACEELALISKKPAEPKKEVKKDAKKQVKKEEKEEEDEKGIEFDFQKSCTEFFFLLGYPRTAAHLQMALKGGLRIDMVVVIKERVKFESRKPDYSLLGREIAVQQFRSELDQPRPANQVSKPSKVDFSAGRAMIQMIKREKISSGQLDNLVIIQVPYWRDMQQPQKDGDEFLRHLFSKVCEVSYKKRQFQVFCKSRKIIRMVTPIKKTVRKEMQVEDKKDEKKGKKDAPVLQMEVVEEVVETPYESIPEHIKSNLQQYSVIAKLKHAAENIYLRVLEDLVDSVDQAGKGNKEELNKLTERHSAAFLNRPLNKMSIKNLRQRVHSIGHPDEPSLCYFSNIYSSAVQLSSEVNLRDLEPIKSAHCSVLQFQFYMRTFSSLIASTEHGKQYNFQDRKYLQRLCSAQINSAINLELQLDPQVLTGRFQEGKQQMKAVMLARINPPGRVLYSNHVFPYKVIPNYQHYIQQSFAQDEPLLDYPWQTNGNLSIRSKRMMPCDNMIIEDSTFSIGDQEHKIVSLQKQGVVFGIKKVLVGSSKTHSFWRVCSEISLDVHPSLKEAENLPRSMDVCMREQAYTVLFSPTPTIFWTSSPVEYKRHIDSKGSVTRYLRNQSIQIYHPNGDISTFKLGKWKHIKQHKMEGGHPLHLTKIVEGSKIINLREDDTAFIQYENGDLGIIFPDGTQIYRRQKDKKIEILNKEGIIIRIRQSRTKDFNVIGHGSAFAYLGFKSIVERSYDGYLFELWSHKFTSHFYIEKYEYENQLVTEEVRLMTFYDGSRIKINSDGTGTYLGANTNRQEENLTERWLQLFTTVEYHKEGVYAIDILEGSIRTKDSETNLFKAQVSQPSESHIAVSFNITNQQQHEDPEVFKNGFHVPQENYFLPPPQNCVPPRLFIVKPDGSGFQFLTEEQITLLKGFHRQTVQGVTLVHQFTKKKKKENVLPTLTFSSAIDWKVFEPPHCIKTTGKNVNLIAERYPKVLFRTLEEVEWSRTYSHLQEKKARVLQAQEERKKQLLDLRNRVK